MQVIGANKGGVVATVEGLVGFVPFSQISTVSEQLVWSCSCYFFYLKMNGRTLEHTYFFLL